MDKRRVLRTAALDMGVTIAALALVQAFFGALASTWAASVVLAFCAGGVMAANRKSESPNG